MGTNLCRQLSLKQQDFEIIDLKMSNQFPEKCKIADVRDVESLRTAVTGDVVVNLAAVHRDLAPPLCFGPHPAPRSCKRSSTLRSDSGKRTYSITAKRMISGLVLKYQNGECFVIRRGYETARPVSSSFCLPGPSVLYQKSTQF